MGMIKRGTVKNAIVGVVEEKGDIESSQLCCPKCRRCFSSPSEAASCSEKGCPLK